MTLTNGTSRFFYLMQDILHPHQKNLACHYVERGVAVIDLLHFVTNSNIYFTN